MKELMQKIEKYLKQNFAFPQKVWIYKDKLIVIDTDVMENKFAFDLTPSFDANKITIQIFSRNKPDSLFFLDEKSAKVIDGKKKYTIYDGPAGEVESYASLIIDKINLYKNLISTKHPKVEKKKYYDIALFGWHYNRNLGGSLTVFVLHQLLKENGFSVVVVPKPGNHKITNGNRPNYEIVNKHYTYAKERPFERLHELRNYCDKFVLASDQLWAGKWIAFKPEFEFLACGDKSVKKISVATSFGGDGESLPFDSDKKEIVTYHLKEFDHISVREPSGVDILRSVGVEGTQILDPVFLCSDSVYDALKKQSKVNVDNEYVMGYILDFQESLINFAAKEIGNGLNVNSNIFTTTMANSKDKNIELMRKWNQMDGINFHSYPSIADFVKLISQASFVVTDSFHGACLCVIFNRPFVCAPRSSRGNSRFALFEKLGLKNRIISRDNFDINIIKDEIDWSEVNRKLNKMRDDSLLWLSKAFDRYMKR